MAIEEPVIEPEVEVVDAETEFERSVAESTVPDAASPAVPTTSAELQSAVQREAATPESTPEEQIDSSAVAIAESGESDLPASGETSTNPNQPLSREADPTAPGPEPVVATAQNQVDLSQQPAEEVKNAAQLTPDERDVLAVQKALQLIADNNTTAAYATLEQEIINNRYALQTRETYAKLLINEGNLLGAYELNEAGLALSPNHPGFKKIKARLLIAQGELDQAVSLLLTRAPSIDADLEYHEILATAQLASRDYEGALISYTGLVRADQSQGKWWYGFAASQDSLGNANAAVQGYSRAVSLANLSANLRRRSQARLAVLSQ